MYPYIFTGKFYNIFVKKKKRIRKYTNSIEFITMNYRCQESFDFLLSDIICIFKAKSKNIIFEAVGNRNQLGFSDLAEVRGNSSHFSSRIIETKTRNNVAGKQLATKVRY